MATLYLMFGYPGAGKTTTANMIHRLTGAVHISSDETRMKMFPHPTFSEAEHNTLYRVLDRDTELALANGKDVIYDANLNRYRHRKDKYDICERTRAKCVLIWVQTPKELAKTRAIHHSRAQLVPTDETPTAMFERIASVIEEPRDNEPYVVIDGTKVTAAYVHQQLGV